MNLSSAMDIVRSGLSNISAQFLTVSQNIANIGTPDYAREQTTQTSVAADGVGMGVFTQRTVRETNIILSSQLMQQKTALSGLAITQTALQSIDAVLGQPSQGSDIGSKLGNLQTGFSTLLANPANQAQQSQIVGEANNLAQQFNDVSQTITAQRQGAQDDLVSAVSTLNTTLYQFGQVDSQIVSATQAGQSTADLENQRAALVDTLSSLMTIQTIPTPSGSLNLITDGGMMLPTRAGPAPFSITPENVGPSVFYPNGGLSGIMLNGNDSTAAMTGGRIGADLQLRDTLMPTAQASIDELAFTVANRFAAQGLSLFTDGSGQVPTGGGTPPQSGYIGFASTMQVNPAVTQNPSLVRDGTNAITGTATGASAFTPNPPGGPAGFNSLIARVVNYTFSGSISNTATQPAPLASGLGPEGNLNLGGYASPGLNDLTASVLVNLATQSNTVSSDYTTTSGLESSLSQKLNNISGVSIDTEMASMLALQNAYAAGGKVMNTLESMFNQLLQAVQ